MPDTTPQVLAVMALMREIERPSACYNRAVRRAAQTLTDSPENDAAQVRGNAALLEVEQAVRAWVAEHPVPVPAVVYPTVDDIVRTIHTKCDDSEHCVHDGEQWPCPTITVIDRQPPARLVLGTTDQQPETAPADEVEQLRKEHATWRKLGQRNLEQAHEENARLRADLRRLADEAQQPETEAAVPVQHAPGKVTCCPDCQAKSYMVCRDEPVADQPDTENEAAPLLWSDLLGAAPDITGGACTQCYMDRVRDRERDMSPEHAHCRAALDNEPATAAPEEPQP